MANSDDTVRAEGRTCAAPGAGYRTPVLRVRTPTRYGPPDSTSAMTLATYLRRTPEEDRYSDTGVVEAVRERTDRALAHLGRLTEMLYLRGFLSDVELRAVLDLTERDRVSFDVVEQGDPWLE